jgi:predicted outer membrane repeat protein
MLLGSGLSMAATVHVPGDHPTIQAAIDAAFDGDILLVHPGTYVENLDFQGKAITVKSVMGPAQTVIDGNQADCCVVFRNGEGPDSVLEGFSITNGIGVFISPFRYGGAIACMYQSSPTIRGNVIHDNSAEMHGGAILSYINSNPMIIRNVIMNNTCASKGGGIYCSSSTGTIVNNLIINNAASSGGGINCAYNSNAVIVNNTSWTNFANSGAGLSFEFNSNATVTNNIVYNNLPAGSGEVNLYNSNPIITYCDVRGGWPGTGNIDKDPLFIDADGMDFHLSRLSPCIDAGDNSAPELPAQDLDGDPRVFPGTRPDPSILFTPALLAVVDIGADERCLLSLADSR